MEPSKGIRSTEFWIIAATGIFLLVNGTPWVNVAPEHVMAWMAMASLYAGLRTTEKAIAIRQNGVK